MGDRITRIAFWLPMVGYLVFLFGALEGYW